MVLLDEWHLQLLIPKDTPNDVARRLTALFEAEVRRVAREIQDRLVALSEVAVEVRAQR